MRAEPLQNFAVVGYFSSDGKKENVRFSINLRVIDVH
jgi:hypothetical protein